MKNDYLTLWENMQISAYFEAVERLKNVRNEAGLELWVQVNGNVSNAIKEEAVRIVHNAYTNEEVEYVSAVQAQNHDSDVNESVFNIRKRKLENDLLEEKSKRFELWEKFLKYARGNLINVLNTLRKAQTVEQFKDWFVKHEEYRHYLEADSSLADDLIAIDKNIVEELKFIESFSKKETATDPES